MKLRFAALASGAAVLGGVACLPADLRAGGNGDASAKAPDASADAGADTNSDGAADAPPPLAFPYAPSNFDPEDPEILRSMAGDVEMTCSGTVTLDAQKGFVEFPCGEPPTLGVVREGPDGPVFVAAMRYLGLGEATTFELVGSLPVILAVYGDAAIYGTVDASGTRSAPGAGGDVACGSSTGGDSIPPEIGYCYSGGGGGGHVTAGAPGGGAPLSGGAARTVARPTHLLGGCRGGDTPETKAGRGGGAIRIAAAGHLFIDGTIVASGGDGEEGSGGGSGGTIVLEGGTVEVRAPALVLADGGYAYAPDGGATGIGGARAQSPGTGAAECGPDTQWPGGGGGAIGRVVIESHGTCTVAGTVSPGTPCDGPCPCPTNARCVDGACCSPFTCSDGCGELDDGCGGTLECDPC